MSGLEHAGPEGVRLAEEAHRLRNWKRWGPYLSERQWGTVREDYSAYGEAWEYVPHDHARSRAYRWGEDGLLGICDRQCRLCFSVALWNGVDPILKERLYGLTGNQGNHGEDVKELYYYLDSTPTHSYMKALYKYPQQAFPYGPMNAENSRRDKSDREYELLDTGIFDKQRYFDVTAEYAKASPNYILIRLTIANRGPETATCHVLPTLWCRNTWAWGRTGEGYWPRPSLTHESDGLIWISHAGLAPFRFEAGVATDGQKPDYLFTENETNHARLFGTANAAPYVKDAFHRFVIEGETAAVNPAQSGTKVAAHYQLEIPAGGQVQIPLRLWSIDEDFSGPPLNERFDLLLAKRVAESDSFYAATTCANGPGEVANVARQAYAGLLWSKQFYHYVVQDWLEGDPNQPSPPPQRGRGRNHQWTNHLYNRDIISMPDKWEYPWYAAWDLAFHMIPLAQIDPKFSKDQLELFLREWYMHPNGQIPAYEWALADVNPPVHAWAAWRVYKMTGQRGKRDRAFLSHVFQKLLMNFTWWVNRKDKNGRNVFSGGFLGLDNIGIFDRSQPLPGGGYLEQADGTAWMAFYCGTMLSMALELAREDRGMADLASKFFEHFLAIAEAMNSLGGSGLWDEEDGFYYDHLRRGDETTALKVRSWVGVIPLFAVEILENDIVDLLPGFKKRMRWVLENRADLSRHITAMAEREGSPHQHHMLAIPSRERLTRVLRYVLDESEFLSAYGIRSLSKVHLEKPYELYVDGERFSVGYVPAESDTSLFGGNSNWRGPIWFPLNFLLIESLERYHHFFGDSLKVECPTGSGVMLTLNEVAKELSTRLCRLFLPNRDGKRPCHGQDPFYDQHPDWRELVLFYEYFDGDDGRGVGASHQTGWTALIARLLSEHSSR